MRSFQSPPLPKIVAAVLLAGAALSGCVSLPPGWSGTEAAPGGATAPPPSGATGSLQFRCDQNITFSVRFSNDSAVIDAGARGSEVLLRDAGGVTPQQTVYSNPRLRAEFGLGVNGREAILRYLAPALVANCMRE